MKKKKGSGRSRKLRDKDYNRKRMKGVGKKKNDMNKNYYSNKERNKKG